MLSISSSSSSAVLNIKKMLPKMLSMSLMTKRPMEFMRMSTGVDCPAVSDAFRFAMLTAIKHYMTNSNLKKNGTCLMTTK